MPNQLEQAPDLLVSLHGGAVKADKSGRVSGYLVRFGTPTDTDTQGHFFTADTDFGSAVKTDVYFDHGFDDHIGREKLGEAELKADERGIWVEGQLDRRNRYVQWIMEAEAVGLSRGMSSVFGWSSGTLPNLAVFAQVGDAYQIKKWPLGLDASITPTPIELRNDASIKGVVSLKSFLDLRERTLKSHPWLAPQSANDGANVTNETMADTKEVKTPEAPSPAQADNAGGDGAVMEPEALKSIAASLKALEILPKTVADIKADVDGLKGVRHPLDTSGDEPDKKADPVVSTSTIKGAYAILGYPLGDTHLKAFNAYIRTGDSRAVEGTWRDAAKPEFRVKASNAVDMQVGTDAEGGYLVPEEWYNGIIERRDEGSIMRAAGAQAFRGSNDTLHVPTNAEADGEWVITAEEVDSDQDTPAIGEVVITAYEFTKFSAVSTKLLNDSLADVPSILMRHAGRGLAKTENQYFLVGTGSGQPQGAFVGGTINADFIAAAAGATAAEVDAMPYQLKSDYLSNPSAVWVMRRATEGLIRGLSGSDRLFRANPGGSVPGRDLLGYQVFNSDKVAANAADADPILFGNLGFYGIYEVVGMTVLRDPYSLARKRQVAFHFSTRFGGAVLQAEAIQVFDQGVA